VFSKYARAEAAVRCGADLVIELPLHISIGSAERFADGAVRILGDLGVVDHLVFGSERDDIALLERTAELLSTDEFHKRMKEKLETGCSYPAARSMVLQAMMNGEDVTCLPNDNLGVEYIRAIHRHKLSMKPKTVLRKGAMHDQVYKGTMKSGSELRGLLKLKEDISPYIPDEAYKIYTREAERGRGPVFLSDLEPMILSRLRMLPYEVFSNLPDASEGLEHKLYKACRTQTNLNAIYDSVKSKRYAHARIRRMTMCAALGVSAEDHNTEPLYARVLALNARGGRVLRKSEKLRSIDVISKPAAARNLNKEQFHLFCSAADRFPFLLHRCH
jgi:predicted nucleotidyltransferase